MKIVVCIKQVPDTATQIKIAAGGKAIETTGITWIVSPYDEFAVEEALRIKEKKGGEVVLVSVGPERAQQALRSGLAMGADSALLVKDAALEIDAVGLATIERLALRIHESDRVLRANTDHLHRHRGGDAGGVEKEEGACVEQPGAVA